MVRFCLSVHRYPTAKAKKQGSILTYSRLLRDPSGKPSCYYPSLESGTKVTLGAQCLHGPEVWEIDGGPVLEKSISIEVVPVKLQALHGLKDEVVRPEHISPIAVRVSQGNDVKMVPICYGMPAIIDIGETLDGKPCSVCVEI